MAIGRIFETITELKAGRTEDLDFTIYGPDKKTPLELAAGDVVRFKLCATQGGTPLLDLRSGEATAGGSTVTITDLGDTDAGEPAAGTVRLAQADTEDFSGTYYGELILVDDSEAAPADAAKPICSGQLTFVASQGGELGLT